MRRGGLGQHACHSSFLGRMWCQQPLAQGARQPSGVCALTRSLTQTMAEGDLLQAGGCFWCKQQPLSAGLKLACLVFFPHRGQTRTNAQTT